MVMVVAVAMAMAVAVEVVVVAAAAMVMATERQFTVGPLLQRRAATATDVFRNVR